MPNPHLDPDPSAATGATGDAAARPRTAAEERLWAALGAQPAATAAELAMTAGIGRSTAAKILARWAAVALVSRTSATTTAGAGNAPGRAAERWSLARRVDDPDGDRSSADEDSDIASGDEAETATSRAEQNAIKDENPRSPEDYDGNHGSDQDTDDQDGRNRDAEDPFVEGRRDHDADRAITAVTDTSDTPAGARTARAATTTPTTADGDVASDRASAAVGERGRRLPPGGLRGMVEDYLREHPDQAFGPSELGKRLGRSGGAVANALIKLVEAGSAVCAQAKPLRYTLAPAERDEQAMPAPPRVTGA